MSFWSFLTNLFGNNQVASPKPASVQDIGVNSALVIMGPPEPLLTANQLQLIMPNCPTSELQIFAQNLCIAMQVGQITTIQRISCFLGQIAYESNQLTEWSENLSYSVRALMLTWPNRFPAVEIAQQYAKQPEKLANFIYANRLGNGDTSSGDGWRFRGRSPIQLTGRANYRACGQTFGIDLENNPDLAINADVGFKICVWYWGTRNLNILADKMDIINITKAINGGTLGLEERKAYTEISLAVLKKG